VTLTEEETARYQRHLSLSGVGAAGQLKLKSARVLIVGAGGLGSPAALYLAAAGVGSLTLIDGDRVELSNLQRQVLFRTQDIGVAKPVAAAAALRALNPNVEVHACSHLLDSGNARRIVSNVDVVVDGSDRLSTRYLVNDACVLERRPLVSAAIHRFEGQAMTYVPGRGPCFRCLFPDAADALTPNCAEAGVLGVLPGVMGSLQATETIKLILGVGEPLVGRLLTYDALSLAFTEFRFTRQLQCAICGEHPSITALITSDAATVRLSAMELKRRLEQQPSSAMQLVDVREMHEFAVAHLPGAVHIPLSELAARLSEIPRAGPIVFICRSGGRSQHAARIASHAGLLNIADLEGGLLAWAAQVDGGFKVAEF
jgi:adenylyltransferase/sulfurtransferase